MSQIVDINHETGDLSQYDTVVVDGGDLSIATPGLISSQYALSCLIDDTTAIYGQKDFSLSSDQYRCRMYFDPNTLSMAAGDIFDISRLLDSASFRALVRLVYESGTLKAKLRVVDDGSNSIDTNYYALSGAEQYIEFWVKYASSPSANNGEAGLWFDGQQQEALTGIDLFDLSMPDNLRVGAVAGLDSGTSGTFLLDEVILNDDGSEIGPVEPPPTIPPGPLRWQPARLDLFYNLAFGGIDRDFTLSEMTQQLCHFGLDYLCDRYKWLNNAEALTDEEWAAVQELIDVAILELLTEI